MRKPPTVSPSTPAAGQGRHPQPALFDRLLQAEHAAAADAPHARQRTARSGDAALRECVLRDMARLFNATRLFGAHDAQAYPHAARSVVNYGVPPLAGMTISELDVSFIEDAIRQALVDYEPRLSPDSVEVRYASDDARVGRQNVLTFKIAAKLWGEHRPVPMLVYTDLDLESGAASVRALDGR